MSNPLTPAVLVQFTSAMRLIADMFFMLPITINIRANTMDANREHVIESLTSYNVTGLYQYDVGTGGRYHTVERTDLGQMLHDGWKIYFYKADIDAAIPGGVNAEKDSLTINGKEYEIRQWTPSAAFSTLGFQLYECDIHFTPGQ